MRGTIVQGAAHPGAGFVAHNALPFEFMMRCGALARALVTTVLLASWNLATTHCAFSAAITPASPQVQEKVADECPMHASKTPAPESQKKNGCPDVPCCKTLPATLAAKVIAKSPECVAKISYQSRDVCFRLQATSKRVDALDTGPPAPNKITEVIFQRSIPAHAPPAV